MKLEMDQTTTTAIIFLLREKSKSIKTSRVCDTACELEIWQEWNVKKSTS